VLSQNDRYLVSDKQVFLTGLATGYDVKHLDILQRYMLVDFVGFDECEWTLRYAHSGWLVYGMLFLFPMSSSICNLHSQKLCWRDLVLYTQMQLYVYADVSSGSI